MKSLWAAIADYAQIVVSGTQINGQRHSAIKALNDTLSYALRKEVLAGAIVVLHSFGRDLGFNVLHP